MERVYPMSPLARSATGADASPASPRLRHGCSRWAILVRKRAARHLAENEPALVDRVADDYRVIGDLGLRVCQVRPSLVWESGRESVITPTGRVTPKVESTGVEVVGRLQKQGGNHVLHARKLLWLVARDVSSRLPWVVRHSPPTESLRRSWNGIVPRLPQRMRRVLRPGAP